MPKLNAIAKSTTVSPSSLVSPNSQRPSSLHVLSTQSHLTARICLRLQLLFAHVVITQSHLSPACNSRLCRSFYTSSLSTRVHRLSFSTLDSKSPHIISYSLNFYAIYQLVVSSQPSRFVAEFHQISCTHSSPPSSSPSYWPIETAFLFLSLPPHPTPIVSSRLTGPPKRTCSPFSLLTVVGRSVVCSSSAVY